jgi:peptidoglycan/LPS O-acetylase OafA/YrhL
MQKRDVFDRSLAIVLLVLSCLLLGPAHALAHGDQLITAFSWFGVLVLGAMQWMAGISYKRRVPPRKLTRFGLLATSAVCAYGALYACQLAGELHYGHATASEYGPALVLAGIAGVGFYEALRSQRPQH